MANTNQSKKEKTCCRFINALEIVYSLFLAIGLTNLLIVFRFEQEYIILLGICIFVLIRFFFAPSKNIESLIKAIDRSKINEKLNYRLVLLCDVPVLFLHAILFTLMCDFIRKQVYREFFGVFIILLVFNSIWLFSIDKRINAINPPCDKNIFFWVKNNLACSFIIFVSLILIPLRQGEELWQKQNGWFIICAIIMIVASYGNSLLDLYKTYRTYLFHSK